MSEQFKARVQYGDWDGTAQADNADHADLAVELRKRGLLHDEEFLIGVEIWIGENHGGTVKPASVRALAAELRNYDSVKAWMNATPDPLPVRCFELYMDVEELFGFYKRISIAIARRGLGLNGREFACAP